MTELAKCPTCSKNFSIERIIDHAEECAKRRAEKVVCPICGDYFPAADIDVHADQCAMMGLTDSDFENDSTDVEIAVEECGDDELGLQKCEKCGQWFDAEKWCAICQKAPKKQGPARPAKRLPTIAAKPEDPKRQKTQDGLKQKGPVVQLVPPPPVVPLPNLIQAMLPKIDFFALCPLVPPPPVGPYPAPFPIPLQGAKFRVDDENFEEQISESRKVMCKMCNKKVAPDLLDDHRDECIMKKVEQKGRKMTIERRKKAKLKALSLVPSSLAARAQCPPVFPTHNGTSQIFGVVPQIPNVFPPLPKNIVVPQQSDQAREKQEAVQQLQQLQQAALTILQQQSGGGGADTDGGSVVPNGSDSSESPKDGDGRTEFNDSVGPKDMEVERKEAEGQNQRVPESPEI